MATIGRAAAVRHHPCLAARFGGVSGGKETHWIPEVANGNGDLPGKAFVLPEDGRAACRTGVKVRALPLSAARVHAAVLPAEELLEPKRAWLLMPPYGAGIIALALLCQSGGDVSLARGVATLAAGSLPARLLAQSTGGPPLSISTIGAG
jgi:hypothetical protein